LPHVSSPPAAVMTDQIEAELPQMLAEHESSTNTV
jgi:hypothetical protein